MTPVDLSILYVTMGDVVLDLALSNSAIYLSRDICFPMSEYTHSVVPFASIKFLNAWLPILQ